MIHFIRFLNLSCRRANRNANLPGNLSSRKTVEQLGRELNKMLSIGVMFTEMRKNIIDDAIAISPCMIEDNLNYAARRHKYKISKNQLIDKEEAETDISEHQTSVLGLISTTAINGGRPKGSKLKNKENLQERMDEAKLHITRLFYSASNLEHRSANGLLV